MKSNKQKLLSDNDRGFTLIEVLIALLVTMVIMGGAYMAFDSQQKSTTVRTTVSDMQMKIRAAVDYMARDIRLAGCNPGIHDLNISPTSFGILDVGIKDISSSMGLNTDYQTGGASYLRLSWDRDGDGVLDKADEIVDYSLFNSSITPGVNDLFLRFPIGGNRQVLASNIIALGLAYAYDIDEDGELEQDGGQVRWAVAPNGETGNWQTLDLATGAFADNGDPIDLDDIRAVRIWLLAESEAPDRNYADSSTYIVGPHKMTSNEYRPNHRHRLIDRVVLSRNLGLEVLNQ